MIFQITSHRSNTTAAFTLNQEHYRLQVEKQGEINLALYKPASRGTAAVTQTLAVIVEQYIIRRNVSYLI